jgi:uncharacterized RDD family membrane protein YckC
MSYSGEFGRASGPRAGFWRRFGAVFIDGLILAIVDFVISIALRGVGYGLSFVVAAVYFTYFEGSSGQTVGKRVLGIRVIDYRTGGSIGYGRAIGRYIGSIISAIFIYIGYLWMLWDGEKQTWHDKIASAVVVPVDAYMPSGMSDMGSRTSTW